MRARVVIFGNSGSGKSTLAKELADVYSCPHMDLDTVAWAEGTENPTRRPLAASEHHIGQFLVANENWIVEGCYSDLLALVIPYSTEIIFLNPGIETCVMNCRSRPWEAHKYESPEEQNANLDMLVDWIEKYPERDDEFSLRAHRKLFDSYPGDKCEYQSNHRFE